MERRDEQSIEAVKLYYQQGLSQAEVATRMGLSRPTVAKLLAHGRERGFVTIEIHDPREDASESNALDWPALALPMARARPRVRLLSRSVESVRMW